METPIVICSLLEFDQSIGTLIEPHFIRESLGTRAGGQSPKTREPSSVGLASDVVVANADVKSVVVFMSLNVDWAR